MKRISYGLFSEELFLTKKLAFKHVVWCPRD